MNAISLARVILYSMALLVAAYIPYGAFAVYNGLAWPIHNLLEPKSFYSALWYSLLFVATIIGNAQIICCIVFVSRRNLLFQNPLIKLIAILVQIAWGWELGATFYFWYLWVIGSAILYAFTPNLNFSWKLIPVYLFLRNDENDSI